MTKKEREERPGRPIPNQWLSYNLSTFIGKPLSKVEITYKLIQVQDELSLLDLFHYINNSYIFNNINRINAISRNMTDRSIAVSSSRGRYYLWENLDSNLVITVKTRVFVGIGGLSPRFALCHLLRNLFCFATGKMHCTSGGILIILFLFLLCLVYFVYVISGTLRSRNENHVGVSIIYQILAK